ncbi:MAG: adenylate kinase [Bacilli bacterium]|nr:adenylate kinase [Bacilli bacterium]
MKNIMFIAPPAAGKGTQAEIIEKNYNIPHISTGDILRDISKENSEIGNYVRETLASGNLVKDEITYQLIKDRLSKDDCKDGYIIDGFPRNYEQALAYDSILKDIGYKVGIVIVIDIDKKILEKRITGRRVCDNCKAVFNINDPKEMPKEETTCDLCGGRLYQRSDDNLEAFQNRYQTYLEYADEIIDYYSKQGVVHHVDGNLSVSDIAKKIDSLINRK